MLKSAKEIADEHYSVYQSKTAALMEEIDATWLRGEVPNGKGFIQAANDAWDEYQTKLKAEGIIATLAGYQYGIPASDQSYPHLENGGKNTRTKSLSAKRRIKRSF